MSSPSQSKADSGALSLLRAASNGDLPSVKALLAAGADVNGANQSGQTALMVAAVMGHAEVVARLIEAGADPQLRDRLGLTALEWATRRGFPEVSRLLAKISPPQRRPSTPKATSAQPGAQTESQPASTPELESNFSQAGEAAPTTSPTGSNEQIQSERPELVSPAVPVDVSRFPEDSTEPAQSDPESEMVATTSPTSGEVEITSESKSPEPAPIEALRSPEEFLEPAKSDPVSEIVSTTWPTTTDVEITSESKSPEPSPVAALSSPEESPELAQSDSVSEMTSTTSPTTGDVEITSESKSLGSEGAPIAASSSPEESLEPAKPDPVSEMVSTTSPTGGDVEITSESKSLAPDSASIEASSSGEQLPEPARSGPVSELASTTSPMSDTVEIPSESKSLAPETPVDTSTLPENLPELSPLGTQAVIEPPAVELEPETQLSVVAPPSPAEPQPQTPASLIETDVNSAAKSRNAASEIASTYSSKKPALDNEEEETLARPRLHVPPAPQRPARPSWPAASSSSIATPAPLERMPWMVDREPAFKASPLGLSTATRSDDSPAVSNLKRCPKCNTIYQNTLLSHCTRDNATLIGVDELPTVAAANAPTPIGVWLLIAFVLGASAFAAYRLTQYFYRADDSAPASVATTPSQPAPEAKKPFFSVGGALAGMEVNVPEPAYPNELQAAGVTGPITVTIRVNQNGRVISAVPSNGDRRLRAAAVKAARQATFAPDKLAAVNARSRVVSGSITYEFVPPQTATGASPAPTETDNSSATNTPNADPNAPVVSDTLVNAATDVPAAEYPARARRAGISGTITVTIRVNRAGRIISWRSSAGDSQLRAAAIRAARRASFSPDKLPETGDTVGTITYNFTP